MVKYYKLYLHDHEACIEGDSEYEYHMKLNKTGVSLTSAEIDEDIEKLDKLNTWDYEEWSEAQGFIWVDVPNVKEGIEVYIKTDRKGNEPKFSIYAPYCDFIEHHRERTKPPKHYWRKAKGKYNPKSKQP